MIAVFLVLAAVLTGLAYGFWLLQGSPTGLNGRIHMVMWMLTLYAGFVTIKTQGLQEIWRQRLARVLDSTGLSIQRSFSRVEASGLLDDMWTRLAVRPVEDGQRIEVTIRGLTRALRLSTVEHVSGEPLAIGDPSFDGAIYLSGDRVTSLALLDAPTRELIAKLGIARLEVEGGLLNAELLMYPADPSTVRASVKYLGAIAHRLRNREFDREAQERSLLEAARSASRAEMRFQCLDAVLRWGQVEAVREEALALAGDDKRLVLAVLHARGELDDEAKLTALVADPGMPSRIRREALGHLPAAADDAAALAAALADHDRRLRAVALARIAARPRSDEGLEVTLLEMLATRKDSERELVIKALGAAGGKASVVPLKALVGMGRVGQMARSAVNAVQGRLVNGEVGAFAVIESPETDGAVSIAADVGAIAISKQKAGE